ncbi:helix-turn-helix transcriptional regulator [Rummeliibacillus sp. POC4]|uniref:helix-turn-helix transcriptional regulator n=1 Tax=Rummeliibacillus sp. POC4 TaxID=2305899 RepID=UPI000E663731|nr:helix-turn-helix transcriptional regulator [Rummeliibacillus sp. POC4]RIJ63119.1 XRE family transcriptional regulator [Rummeliibacillus sp. POC4]
MEQQDLKKLLVSKREKLGLTHQDVAVKSGASITRQYYGMIENGERRPSVDVAKKIANVLGIDWTIFFDVICNRKLHERTSA